MMNRRTLIGSCAMFALSEILASRRVKGKGSEIPTFESGAWVLPERPGSEPVLVPSDGSYESAVYVACAIYGCDPEGLIRVMYCESPTGEHDVYGPNGEHGIFQIHPSGAYADYYNADPYTQIDLAARQFAAGLGDLEDGGWACAPFYYG